MRYLVDTDWVIDYLHRREPVVIRLIFFATQGIGLSIVSLAELYEGVFFSSAPRENEKALLSFLNGVTLLYLDDSICQIFARERGRLREAVKYHWRFRHADRFHGPLSWADAANE